jgi:hypothetical protein
MRSEPLGYFCGKFLAVDGERAAGGDLVSVGGLHDQGAGAAHLLMQEPDGIKRSVIAAKGVGAYELGETGGLMRLGRDVGAHFMDDDGHAMYGGLPGCLRAGKTAADDMDWFRHGRHLTRSSVALRWPGQARP